MTKQLGQEFYTILDKGVYNSCCDSIQFKYLCKTCGQNAGCYFCSFNPDEKHECNE